MGKPDFGYLTATEMIDTASRIAVSFTIPLIADMDNGYGNPLNVIRTADDIVNSKAAGIILEDRDPRPGGSRMDKHLELEQKFGIRPTAGPRRTGT